MLKALFSTAILLVLLNLNLNAQNLKLGVVDVQTVIMQMPEAQSADQMLKDITLKYQDTIGRMRKELEEKLDRKLPLNGHDEDIDTIGGLV
ncbi:MAG: OmpH family outer membrane protein, partial [Candidatus Kapabacteria bacterium]|nr:OmpH family outer membrane protein [Candidatus Kapabacteria bacterium]